MLNDKLIQLERYNPIINYLNRNDTYSKLTKAKGWHCCLDVSNNQSIHVVGANTPIIALNIAEDLLHKGKIGIFKIDCTGEIIELTNNI